MLYRRGDLWWIEIHHSGRRIRRSTRLRNKAAAERWHDEFKARLWQEKITGKCLSHALVLWLQAKARSRNDKNAVRLIRRIYADRALIEVTPASVTAALTGKRPGTYNRLLAVIRASMNLALARGWMESAPKFAKRLEPTGRVRYLTADEWKRLESELPPHVRFMAQFTLATGLRWANVAGLKWSQIAIQNRIAWIEPFESKNRSAIPIPLSATALACLAKVRGQHAEYVFTYRGNRIASCKTAWRAACLRAHLLGLHWHDLRHTWATWHVMNGTPLEVVQKLGGWKTRAMVERYAHYAPGYIAGFADNAKPVSTQTPHRVAGKRLRA